MSCEVMGDLQPSIGKRRPKENTNLLNTSLNSNEDKQLPFNQITIRTNDISGDQNSNNGLSNDDEELKYGAKHVIKIFTPVSICMLIVVITVLSTPYYQRTNVYMVYTPYTDQKVDNSTRLWQSFANALILITVIIFMSFLLILLYKKRYYKVINGWLLFSSLSILFMITSAHVYEVLKVLNQPVDYLTVVFLIWNFGVIGMIAIHWKGPVIVQQSYLLFISSLMALTFIKYIPEWTIWTVLFTVSIWDLVAVLCPQGPLRILVETAQERNEQLFPSLVYSSGMAYTIVNSTNSNEVSTQNKLIDFQTESPQQSTGTNQETNNASTSNQSSTSAVQQPPQQSSRLLVNGQNTTTQIVYDTNYSTNSANNSSTPLTNESEDQGVKLGLGDFVFYSILVGKVSTYGDWNTTLACFVAILIGLCLTLLLLAIIKTALPALPISITFGLIFYFSTSFVVQPFTSELAFNQIFI